MPQAAQVQEAITAYTAAQLVAYPIAFGNSDSTGLSNALVPYLVQNIVFRESKQFQLGDTESAKEEGSVLFAIHVRRNTGDGARNAMRQAIIDAFRSKVIGGATFLKVRNVTSGNTANWALTVLEIPFYFYDQ